MGGLIKSVKNGMCRTQEEHPIHHKNILLSGQVGDVTSKLQNHH